MAHSFFSVTCVCGVTHAIQQDGQAFTCACGRKGVVDFGVGYSERELIAILNHLDTQRDRIARAIENRREKRVAA